MNITAPILGSSLKIHQEKRAGGRWSQDLPFDASFPSQKINELIIRQKDFSLTRVTDVRSD